MKIVYLAAGAAGMYCGSCLHDNTLAAALSQLGEDILLVPTYTPLRTDEENVSAPLVLYGGLNVYLQQHSRLFSRLPRFIERWLDSPRTLAMLSRFSGSVRAESLGPLTVSMLQGEEGKQRRELEKLVAWLSAERPDIVHLSNAMLIGMAREIRKRVGAQVVCTLSGEDIFLGKLVEPYASQAKTTMRERAGDVAAYVALNQYYADEMREYLGVERERVHVIPHGLKLDGHGDRAIDANRPFTIGYLARVCHEKGLHALVDAFIQLARDPDVPGVRLRAAGYLGAGDREYYKRIEQAIQRAGLADQFEYLGEVSREEKIAFLQSLDVLSVPTVYRESKGIYVLEALANAVPVVLPNHGAFPELVRETQGGLLYKPGDQNDLIAQLKMMILRRDLGDEWGRRGQSVVRDRFNAQVMAERTRDLYHQLMTSAKPEHVASPSH